MGTLTTNLGLDKPTVGADADQWGTLLNQSLDTLDLSVQFGALTKSVAGGVNVTLTANEAAKQVIILTGLLTANIAVIVPNSPVRRYVVRNNTTGAFTVTVRRAVGTGVVVPQGGTRLVYNDGSEVFFEDVQFAQTAASVLANGVSTTAIQDDAVTFLKTQNIQSSRILGRLSVGVGDIEELTSEQVSTFLSITDKIQPIIATVSANAMTVTLNPTTLDFRSATLSSGISNTRIVNSAISLVIPSGATLGTINGIAARFVVLAIDNAGVVELAIVNISGGNPLDETGVINTTALSAASDSANVIYSTIARTSVPYRVVGFVDNTQATAGTYATAPSLVQGIGGQALAALSSIGYGQTWQTFTVGTQRISGTIYYNTTGKPIAISVARAGASNAQLNIAVNGLIVANHADGGATQTGVNLNVIVPAGASYSATSTGAALSSWYELR